MKLQIVNIFCVACAQRRVSLHLLLAAFYSQLVVFDENPEFSSRNVQFPRIFHKRGTLPTVTSFSLYFAYVYLRLRLVVRLILHSVFIISTDRANSPLVSNFRLARFRRPARVMTRWRSCRDARRRNFQNVGGRVSVNRRFQIRETTS